MRILDYLKRKKQKGNKLAEQDLPKIFINNEEVNDILEKEIKNFFPNNGEWSGICFIQPSEVDNIYLPCHLRDNDWMSKLLYEDLNKKGIFIPQPTIKNFMDQSKSFANLRHEHELRIVKWQINWICNNGNNWIMPKGYNEFTLLFGEDVDKMIRGGVVETLRTIGMNGDVIEEGLEKYSDIWRLSAMTRGFSHLYEPAEFMAETKDFADKDHKKNWLADREYQYYQTHKNSVDNYGTLTPAMQMTPEEHDELVALLTMQNAKRSTLIKNWAKNPIRKQNHYSINNDNEDTLNR